MEWYAYPIIIMGIIIFFGMIAIFLSREQIKLKLKCFIHRKGDYLLCREMGDDFKFKDYVKKVEDGKIQLTKTKVYTVKKEHTYFVPAYGITGVILSESLGTSIDPTGQSTYSPTTVDGLIKRVKAVAMGENLKIIQIMYMILFFFGLIVLGQIFMIVKFYMALKEKGIEIAF